MDAASKLTYVELFDSQWQSRGYFSGEEGGSSSSSSDEERRKPLEELTIKDLYEILKDDGVSQIVSNFYSRIWAKDDWFKQSFAVLADFDHHVWAQTAFWMECFGKGPVYHGGNTRLKFHHSRAEKVMNVRGAERWMAEMNLTLKEVLPKVIFEDAKLLERVEFIIRDFIQITMQRYGQDFKFETASVLEEHNKM
jgi:truncated hemoglobin YjbI